MKEKTKTKTAKRDKTKNDKKMWQESHKPDFKRIDLWQFVTMNPSGEFTYGFDDEDEAKKYVTAMKKRNHPLRIIPLDEALEMPFPPTYQQNWNYSKIYDLPKGLFPEDNAADGEIVVEL